MTQIPPSVHCAVIYERLPAAAIQYPLCRFHPSANVAHRECLIDRAHTRLLGLWVVLSWLRIRNVPRPKGGNDFVLPLFRF
jgi:hypothetical protein